MAYCSACDRCIAIPVPGLVAMHWRRHSQLSVRGNEAFLPARWVFCRVVSTAYSEASIAPEALRTCADEVSLGRMLAVKRRPAFLDQFADDMPLTRSIRQRLEEDEELDLFHRSGGARTDDFVQLEGKDAQKGHTPSFVLAADGSSAALRQSANSASPSEADAAVRPAVQQLAAFTAGETSKQAQHETESGRADASAAPSTEQSTDSALPEISGVKGRPDGPALRCRVSMPNEIQQSPMRTRSQDLSETDFAHLSSSSEEACMRSSAVFEGILLQHSCGVTPQPSSNTQQPKSPRVRQHRISFILGATDGGVTTSQRTVVASLKSCIRKESTIRYGSRPLMHSHTTCSTSKETSPACKLAGPTSERE